MAIGPVQLIVLGFSKPDFHGEIIAELQRLHDEDTVRVIDALAVHKDADGEIEVQHLSNLSKDEAVELGGTVGALIGLGIEGETGAEEGAVLGAEAAADGAEVFSDEQAWDVLERDPERLGCGACAAGASLGGPAAGRDCARRWFSDQRRFRQSARPGRDRAHVSRGSRCPARLRDFRSRLRK
jgi:hypothetical protein